MTITDTKFEKLKESYQNFIPHLENLHEDFGGPSVYFHQQALIECKQNFLSDRHIEMIYATLCAWGMHRMGDTKTKMVSFAIFKNSIITLAPQLKELQMLGLDQFEDIPLEILQKLQDICFQLQASVSNSRIVGNSKTLAHLLPNLTPPIDRQYTIRFFAKTLSNFKNLQEEIEFYNHITHKCYEFIQILKKDTNIKIDDQFNSSLPKIFDNLLMVFLKKTEIPLELV
jgi:hypothetical protein